MRKHIQVLWPVSNNPGITIHQSLNIRLHRIDITLVPAGLLKRHDLPVILAKYIRQTDTGVLCPLRIFRCVLAIPGI